MQFYAFHGTPTTKFRPGQIDIFFAALFFALRDIRLNVRDIRNALSKRQPRALAGIIMLAKFSASARSRRVGSANYPCNEQIKVVPDAIPKRAEQRATSSFEK